MIPRFQMTREDERETFFVNGEQVASTSHDAHGWDGMEAARDLFEAVAQSLGAEVEEVDQPPIPHHNDA